LTRGKDAEALAYHAAACDCCGTLLRQSLADFAEDVTPEEEAMLTTLESSGHEWQEQMAVRLSSAGPWPSIFAWLRQHLFPNHRVPVWVYAAGVAVLGAPVALICLHQPSVENLLAAAYTDQRTIELRIPEASYGPLRLVRGSRDRSRLNRPLTLLEGEARIASQLAKSPDSPRWLQARGRAELLDRDFDSAIGDLRRCLSLQPASPLLMTDLASAYFERAEANGSRTDYDATLDLLNHALTVRPDDPVALFNRAIVYERLQLNDQAVEDWRHYLRVDHNSTWNSEARQRLADVEQARKK
jgi:tetratricopeptide (TPR) repeat protein